MPAAVRRLGPLGRIQPGKPVTHITWILVADQGGARLFSLDRASINELDTFVNPAARGRSGAALGQSARGRTISNLRNALETHTDPRQAVTRPFARRLRDVLERGRSEQRYDDLVLVAPRSFLGTLGAALPTPLRARVVARIGRDLTQQPATRIRELLPAVAAEQSFSH
jgi:protein required for attachment to host cells